MGGRDQPWSQHVNAVRYGEVDGHHLFVVAAGSDTDSTGAAIVYKWDRGRFTIFDEFHNVTDAVDAEFFYQVDQEGVGWHYCILARSTEPSQVYRFEPNPANGSRGFRLRSTLPFTLPDGRPLPPQCADAGTGACDSNFDYVIPGVGSPVPAWGDARPTPSARRLKTFIISDIQYVAVAYWWPTVAGYSWFSYVYRWNSFGTNVGFRTFQIIPTDGATDVDFATWNQP
eukprot:2576383-Rhodomonas_salina.1